MLIFIFVFNFNLVICNMIMMAEDLGRKTF